MRIKLDENVPSDLAETLSAGGHDTDTSPQEQLRGQPDEVVWTAAQEARRFLITQDMDFSDIRRFAPGTHAGLLLLRLREPSRQGIIERVERLFQTTDVEAWAGCFVVATDHKVRVRRATD